MASSRRVERSAERAQRARGGGWFASGTGIEHDLAAGIFRAACQCSGSIGGSTTVHDSTPPLTCQQLAELRSRSGIFSGSCRAMGVQSFLSRARVKCASCRRCEGVCRGPAYGCGRDSAEKRRNLECWQPAHARRAAARRDGGAAGTSSKNDIKKGLRGRPTRDAGVAWPR
jgi:hypothetical protein